MTFRLTLENAKQPVDMVRSSVKMDSCNSQQTVRSQLNNIKAKLGLTPDIIAMSSRLCLETHDPREMITVGFSSVPIDMIGHCGKHCKSKVQSAVLV